MFQNLKASNISNIQVSEFILMGFPGIHSWQHWLSLLAICQPLRYPSIITESFVVKATVFMALRNTICTIPVPILAAQRHYCSQSQIEHCLCSNLGVTSLSCDDRTINSIYQLILAWTLMGSDLGLIILSYCLILHSVLKLNSAEAASKALSTCTSHLILILFFYTVVIVISITHSAAMSVPIIPVLLNVLHNVIPPALNPMVYALKNKELRQGLYKVLRVHIKSN
ncbi:PREDICTED: putative olfactory receptor 56B2 [Myotis davidii]|uniref:Putative olfactory receptor 56B2 n=1 Tax=Myotis davidii TaxID=225400 RepID=L5LGU7_MYODS|nr:PREDICTED: putative olfactory receptor 56B2 [Myotis davidii]ELK25427.1 Putative olfactory receptor 56B2 [Myotis davidii]